MCCIAVDLLSVTTPRRRRCRWAGRSSGGSTCLSLSIYIYIYTHTYIYIYIYR